MKNRFFFLLVILAWMIAVVYALSGQPHEFRSGQCSLCHVDEKNRPAHILPDVTAGCNECHSGVKGEQSHPTDVYPSLAIPGDLPLVEGKLTCITCHYVHPREKMHIVKKHFFLRRMSKGIFFCATCHDIDRKNHIVRKNIHRGTYKVTNSGTRIDSFSLDCIQCHDRHIGNQEGTLGAGVWRHNTRFNHPIGVSYASLSRRKSKDFKNASLLRKEVKLIDGKIGCGTCHNIYSREKGMLVVNNRGSRLCMECHIK